MTTILQEWVNKSKSNPSAKPYTTAMHSDGLMTCDCRGYWQPRPGKAKECSHIKDLFRDHGWPREERGLLVYATVAPVAVAVAVAVPVAVPVPSISVPTAMKAVGMTEAIWSGIVTDEAFAARFNTGQWVMDEKLDGHRCVVRVQDGRTYTDLKSVELPPHIVAELVKMPNCVVDGELRIPGGISTDVPNLKLRSQLELVLFDALEIMGDSVMGESYTERRGLLELLQQHMDGTGAVTLCRQFEPTLANVRAIWAEPNGEGAILKKRSSRYVEGDRSADWIKIKKLEAHAVTVTGFEAGSLGPTAITLFRFDDGAEGRCKTLNNEELAATAANQAAFIGRRLVIQCQQRIKGKSPRHPMWDHWAGAGE